MTNYERIKEMSVEELEDFLNNFELCGICAFNDKLCKVDEECHEGILTWLKQEARDDFFCQDGEAENEDIKCNLKCDECSDRNYCDYPDLKEAYDETN